MPLFKMNLTLILLNLCIVLTRCKGQIQQQRQQQQIYLIQAKAIDLQDWFTFQCKTIQIGLDLTELGCAKASGLPISSKVYLTLHKDWVTNTESCLQCGADIVGMNAATFGTPLVWSVGVTKTAYRDCQDAFTHGHRVSGVYSVSLSDGSLVEVWCEQQLYGGGWTVIQQRQDGSVNFMRTWANYKNGFGDLTTEFWLGNQAIYLLTKGCNKNLRIELQRTDGVFGIVDYQIFCLENEADSYALRVSGFKGTVAGDSLSYHNTAPFRTADFNDNNCAASYQSGWWYKSCHRAHLNGDYSDKSTAGGVTWLNWAVGSGSHQHLSAVRMMIRGSN